MTESSVMLRKSPRFQNAQCIELAYITTNGVRVIDLLDTDPIS